MIVHRMRPGDFKITIAHPLREVRSPEEGVYDLEWWMVSSGAAIEGAGFTIVGRKRTDFLTWSSFDFGAERHGVLQPGAVHVWTSDDQVHVVHDLCTRGLKLPKEETDRFIRAWSEVFSNYLRSRRNSPPKTYTFSEALEQPWGKGLKALIEFGLKSPVGGPVTEAEVAKEATRFRRDLE